MQGGGRGLWRACPFVWVAAARRARWRLPLLAAECLAAAVCGVALWRATCLWGLPAVGAPAAPPAPSKPLAAETSAAPTVARALRAYRPWPVARDSPRLRLPLRVWHPEDRNVQSWLRMNRPALDLLYAASGPEDLHTLLSQNPVLGAALLDLTWLAAEDAGAAQTGGDPERAWKCTFAMLRAARELSARGDLSSRSYAQGIRARVKLIMPLWLADPRVRPELIRRALADAQALQTTEDDDVAALRSYYTMLATQVRQPEAAALGWHPWTWVKDWLGVDVPPPAVLTALEWRGWVRRDPERNTRLLDLTFANWLARASLPPSRRPKPAVRAVVSHRLAGSVSVTLYDFPAAAYPEVHPAARALPPQVLARRLVENPVAAVQIGSIESWLRQLSTAESRDHSALVLSLATSLYEREHGRPPKDSDELVGPYLKALPGADAPAGADPDEVEVIRGESS